MTRPNTDPTNPYRAGQTNARGTIICGAKNRNGQTDNVPLTFRKELMRFESRARDEQNGG